MAKQMEVDLVLNTAPAEQQAAAFAARHQSMMIGGGRGGTPATGQGVTPSTAFSAGVSSREQAAVDRAMAMAQERSARMESRGGYHAGAAGDLSAGARIDTSGAQSGIRQIRGLWQALKREIENDPIRVNFLSSAMAGGMHPAAAAAAAAAMPAGRQVAPHANPLSVGPPPLPGMAPLTAGPPPLPLQLMPPPLPGRQPSGSPRGGQGGRSQFLRMPNWQMLLFTAGMGLGEVSSANSAIRDAELDAMFSDSPEEAAMIRAQAAKQAGAGFFGGILNAAPNWFYTEGSPDRLANEARAQFKLKELRATRGARQLEIANERAARGAFVRGGTTGVEATTVAGQMAEQLRVLEERKRNFEGKLSERYQMGTIIRAGSSTRYGGELVLKEGSEDRKEMQSQLDAVNQEIANERERAAFEQQMIARELSEYRGAFERAQTRSNVILRGGSDRDVAKLDIKQEFARRREEEVEPFGDVARRQLDDLEQRAIREEELGFSRERLAVNRALKHADRQTRFRRGGPQFELDAALDDVVAGTNSEAYELERRGMPDEAAKRRRLGWQQAAAAKDDYLRSLNFEEVSPTRAFGSLSVGDVEKKLADAKRAMEDGGKGKDGAGWTAADIARVIGLLETMSNGYVPARVR